MPTYQFICRDCEIILEEDHSMDNAPSTAKCPECEETIK